MIQKYEAIASSLSEVKLKIKEEFPVQEFLEWKKIFKNYDEVIGPRYNFIVKFKLKKCIDKCSSCGCDIYGRVAFIHKQKVCNGCYKWEYEKDRHNRNMKEIYKRKKLQKLLKNKK